MRRILLVAAVALAATSTATGIAVASGAGAAPGGRELFVSASGSDGNDGLSASRPFKTIQKASDATQPGDTVSIMDGTYTSGGYGAPLTVRRSGTTSAPITYRAVPGQHPVLKVGGGDWNGVRIDASYITVEGLTVTGEADSISYDEAYAHRTDRAASAGRYDAGGITWDSRGTATKPTHITVRGNTVSKMPGCGICGLGGTDYLTVDGNTVSSNSWWTIYATSGISVGDFVNSDGATGLKNFVRGNVSHDNETRIPWERTGKISDGNGIIIDDGTETSSGTDSDALAYRGRTLVANNVSYHNGGSGIHAFATAHVDIVNNTAYENSASPALQYANIFSSESTDVRVLNNIAVARPGEEAGRVWGDSSATRADYNVWWGGNAKKVGANDIVADPKLASPGSAGFRLQSGSPAIDSGTAEAAPAVDHDGTPRPAGAAVDRGAFEFGGPSPVPTTSAGPTPAPSGAPSSVPTATSTTGTPGGGASSRVPAGTFRLVNKASGKAIEIGPADRIQQGPVDAGHAQLWTARWQPDGTVVLVCTTTDKALDVPGRSNARGTQLIQWKVHNGKNQRWKVRPGTGTSVRLVSVSSRLLVDLRMASTANGAAIQQESANGSLAQEWNLVTP